MKRLVIRHLPPEGKKAALVEVRFYSESDAEPQQARTEFKFEFTEEQRKLIQWYLEEYLIFPYGEFITRAQRAEQLMERLGKELFEAIFKDSNTNRLYSNVANDLENTRVIIHAESPEGIAIPWELMRDPAREEYGAIARRAHAFVRSQPNVVIIPPSQTSGDTFNILLVISRPGGPEGDVPFQSVARPLLELFRPYRERIRVDVLRPPTFEQLTKLLNDNPGYYHVLHFDGHGAFPGAGHSPDFYAQPGAQGQLLFESEDGKDRHISGEE